MRKQAFQRPLARIAGLNLIKLHLCGAVLSVENKHVLMVVSRLHGDRYRVDGAENAVDAQDRRNHAMRDVLAGLCLAGSVCASIPPRAGNASPRSWRTDACNDSADGYDLTFTMTSQG